MVNSLLLLTARRVGRGVKSWPSLRKHCQFRQYNREGILGWDRFEELAAKVDGGSSSAGHDKVIAFAREDSVCLPVAPGVRQISLVETSLFGIKLCIKTGNFEVAGKII